MKIDPADWSKVNKLLDEALKRPASDHADWLRTLATEYREFEPLLRRLLSRVADVETQDFLEDLPAIDVALTPPPAADQQVGAYRLIRQLGSGGMASVWLAERTDGLIDRQVALKLPHPALGRIFAQRAERERDFLAKLDHPNIARLYDAGLTETGQPFLALEYIPGIPINQYCDEAGLGIRSRVRLFAAVIDAMAHAHAKLIIHRDVKPSNVLVNAEGEVRLVDFGIAKLLQHDSATATELTQVSGRALTTAYAAPEQIRGETLTVAADIYSLGVLLYELLAGQQPFAAAHSSAAELENAVVNDLPQRPSLTATKPGDAQLIAGDLDVIVLKAISKEPDRRYATCHTFGEDLRRYLNDEPVLARPNSFVYQARKFAFRHKLGVTFAVSVALMLVVIAVLATRYAITTDRQAKEIAVQRDRAEQVTEFMASVFESADPNVPAAERTAREILERGRERIAEELADQPEVQAELLAAMSRVYNGMRMVEEAKETITGELELREALNDVNSAEYAEILIRLSQVSDHGGDLEQALHYAEQALAVSSRLDDPVGQAWARLRIGRTLHLQGDFENAEPHFRYALGRFEAEIGGDHEDTQTVRLNLANLLHHQQKYEDSLALFEDLLATHERVFGMEHSDTGPILLGLAQVLSSLGRYEEAGEMYQRTFELNDKLFGKDNPRNMYIVAGMGKVAQANGEYDRAIAHYEDSSRLVELNSGADNSNYGITRRYIADVYVLKEEFDRAVPFYREALGLMTKHIPDHWYVSDVRWRLGESLSRLGQDEEAESLLVRAVDTLTATRGTEDGVTQSAIAAAAAHFERTGNLAEAAGYRAIVINE